MARYIKQYRFYKEDNKDQNYPKEIAYKNLISGSIFEAGLPIIQLGIQALPGTKFYLNHSKEPVIIGQTGIYELDLQGKAEITALSFDGNSLSAINANQNAYLIVDTIYEKPEEE